MNLNKIAPPPFDEGYNFKCYKNADKYSLLL